MPGKKLKKRTKKQPLIEEDERKILHSRIVEELNEYDKIVRYYDDALKEEELEDLESFNRFAFAYINGIFGSGYLRNKIVENLKTDKLQPKEDLYTDIMESEAEFDESDHWIVRSDADTEIEICSDDQGYQKLDINFNDTLCQSYSLMNIYGLLDKFNPEPSNRINHIMIQMEMIAMYREIVRHKKFTVWLKETFVDIQNRNLPALLDENYEPLKWGDSKKLQEIIEKILQTLDQWEEFGYIWFTGNPEKELSQDRHKRIKNGGKKYNPQKNKVSKSKTKRKKAKGKTRTKKRYKSYKN
tara:strand:- start:860 stop:1756 length:897 start_codon:yes stop_codon:yes gene_type:complete